MIRHGAIAAVARAFLTAACLVALAVSPVMAQPSGAASFKTNGASVRFPGWSRQPAQEPAMLMIEADDGPATELYRVCELKRLPFPFSPGLTQAAVNQRLMSDGEAQYAPRAAELGRVEFVRVQAIDGIAVVDYQVDASETIGALRYRLRTFVLVSDGGADYYQWGCAAMGPESAAQRADTDAVIESLQFTLPPGASP